MQLLAHCYGCGLVPPGLCYGFLAALQARFAEADVAAMVTLLNAVGGACWMGRLGWLGRFGRFGRQRALRRPTWRPWYMLLNAVCQLDGRLVPVVLVCHGGGGG